MTCLDCRYYAYIDEKPMCKRYPPRALAAMPYFWRRRRWWPRRSAGRRESRDGNRADGKQQCQIIIDFPTLNRNIACGEWKYRKEVCPADEPV